MFSSNTSQVSSDANWIEECFQTHLYTGNGSTQTITNGIDLSGKGGLTWSKRRDSATGGNHVLIDTVRGAGNYINTNTTSAQATDAQTVTAFATTGYSIGTSTRNNTSAGTYASWTFRKQPKFFDVVTFTTGASNTNQRISHSLGSVPGCIIVKRTDGVDNWFVWHRSLPSTTDDYLYLNTTAATQNTGGAWGATGPTSTDFGVDDNFFGGGRACVAYIFAHNAGGFGLTGTDNVISCGSYTGNGSTDNIVTLGYEPQWIMIKDTTGSTNPWVVVDNMRGMSLTNRVELYPSSSNAELVSTTNRLFPTATGFTLNGDNAYYNTNGSTYIYIAIRRGPMKVPTSGTSVYNAISRSGTAASATVSGVGFASDLVVVKGKSSGDQVAWNDRLRGTLQELISSGASAEITTTDTVLNFTMDGMSLGADATRFDYNATSHTYINWFLKRAPSFFDEVCYTGNGTSQNISHNLAAIPELMLVKRRNVGGDNFVSRPSALGQNKYMYLTTMAAADADTGFWNDTSATSSVFTVGNRSQVNSSGSTYVAYLFATCAGVSKVGTYTGNGSTQTINCGFTGGARFILIKRTDATGAWFVWDSARGITSGNDPSLMLNSTAAEVVDWNSVGVDSTGFTVTQNAYSVINSSGGTYIFLAIA